MNVVKLILNNCLVLRADYTDAGSCSLSLAVYDRGGGMESESRALASVEEAKKELSSRPVILILSGYGVIAKQVQDPGAAGGKSAEKISADSIVDKVKSNDQEFVWSEGGKVLTFMRREQAAPLLEQLSGAKAKLVDIVCFKAADSNARQGIQASVAASYDRVMTLRTMLLPRQAGSALCLLTVARIRLGLLGIVLLLLLVNAMVSGGVRSNYSQVHGALQAALESRGRQDDAARDQQQKLADFSRRPPYGYAWLSDRIAGALPDKINLHSLAIQPLLKPVEENKKVQVAESVVVIRGMAPRSEEISLFTAALHELGIATRIRLASVEQNRDNNMLDFKIELEL